MSGRVADSAEGTMQFKLDAQPAGQGAALWMSTIAFTVRFAVWTIFSIIGVRRLSTRD
jgi:nitrate/nitrite transporter NarK